MSQEAIIKKTQEWKTAIFALMVAALGMGMGRFLYTPMLAVMLHEGGFTFSQLSLIATCHYIGYLIGSAIFSFSYFKDKTIARRVFIVAAVITAFLMLNMGLFSKTYQLAIIRFLAGLSTSGILIFGAAMVIQTSNKPIITSALFSGVGIGIILGNEYVLVGEYYNLSSISLWLFSGIISFIFLVFLLLFLPKNEAINKIQAKEESSNVIHGGCLALIYGLAGFGYIIAATYLPILTKTAHISFLSDRLWSMVGLAIIPSCYLWIKAASKWGTLNCLAVNLVAQSFFVLLTLYKNNTSLLIISALGFGATFMGAAALVMPLAKKLKVKRNINLFAVLTLSYGLGQVCGPLLAILLWELGGGVESAIVCAAVALFIAASITQYCLFRNKRKLAAAQ